MKNESTYRIVVVALLAGILLVQAAVLIRSPKHVTIADLENPKLTREQRSSMTRDIQVVRIDGEVSVDVQNYSLDVDISGQPIEVKIVR